MRALRILAWAWLVAVATVMVGTAVYSQATDPASRDTFVVSILLTCGVLLTLAAVAYLAWHHDRERARREAEEGRR